MAGVVLEMKMKNDEKNKALEVAIGQIESLRQGICDEVGPTRICC